MADVASCAYDESEALAQGSWLGAVQDLVMRNHTWRADHGRVGVRGLCEDVGRCSWIPMRVLAAYRGRPHEIENGREVDNDVDAVTGFYGIGD